MTILPHLKSQCLACESTAEERGSRKGKEGRKHLFSAYSMPDRGLAAVLSTHGIFLSSQLSPLSVTIPSCGVHLIVPVFQKWKSKLREIKSLAQGHPRGRYEVSHQTQVRATPEPVPCTPSNSYKRLCSREAKIARCPPSLELKCLLTASSS